jgi:hypothetical protein
MNDEEQVATQDRIVLMDRLVGEVLALVKPSHPEPACWMAEDACASYCWDCAQMARAKELGLPAPLREPEPNFSWLRTEDEEAAAEAYEEFQHGIDGGYHGQCEHDNCEHCDTCGKLLAYTLTDYGARDEIEEWPQCVILPVGAGWHPDASYSLDRVHMCLGWQTPPAWMVEGVIAIAAAALSTTL